VLQGLLVAQGETNPLPCAVYVLLASSDSIVWRYAKLLFCSGAGGSAPDKLDGQPSSSQPASAGTNSLCGGSQAAAPQQPARRAQCGNSSQRRAAPHLTTVAVSLGSGNPSTSVWVPGQHIVKLFGAHPPKAISLFLPGANEACRVAHSQMQRHLQQTTGQQPNGALELRRLTRHGRLTANAVGIRLLPSRKRTAAAVPATDVQATPDCQGELGSSANCPPGKCRRLPTQVTMHAVTPQGVQSNSREGCAANATAPRGVRNADAAGAALAPPQQDQPAATDLSESQDSLLQPAAVPHSGQPGGPASQTPNDPARQCTGQVGQVCRRFCEVRAAC
jgi:hypothetical protein